MNKTRQKGAALFSFLLLAGTLSFSVQKNIFAEDVLSIKTGAPHAANLSDEQEALQLPRQKTGGWLPESISAQGDKVDRLFTVILWITGSLFIFTQGFLIYFLFRYRARKNRGAHYTEGHAGLEIVWTLIPLLIVTWLAFQSQNLWSEVKSIPADTPDTLHVRIQAEQFAWNVHYPGKDGKWDTADDVISINQMNIPVDRPVRVTLTSIEKEDKPAVIHSFFLPEFRLKQDVVPGMAIDVWFKARRTGKFEIACSEFCGLGHYRMKGFLNIHTASGFEKWLQGIS